ncbi:MAG TPA: T9SS type A sorting domain-containing protein [Bacteroidales bacterium]|nr:T9SS type A sorting domain-containing protein [Bacteroidales bacterium]
MVYYKLKTGLLFLLVILGLNKLQAQEVIAVSGNESTSTEGTSSYTIGQIVYETYSGTNGTIAQGVQQAYEISVISGINPEKEIIIDCQIFPNPTINDLTLKIENYNNEAFSYFLYDINGYVLENNKIISNETIIPTQNLTPATYFLKVTDHKDEKIFKIIKN